MSSGDSASGAFALLYSVPASYRKSVGRVEPAIYSELTRRNYEVVEINHERGLLNGLSEEEYQSQLRSWLDKRTVDKSRPYFVSLMIDRSIPEVDREIHRLILLLSKEDLLKNTHVILTAASSSSDFVPFLWLTPDRKNAEFQHPTSHYDLMPTLMQKLWSCKKSFKVASIGRPLEDSNRDWILFSDENSFKIYDYKAKSKMMVDQGSVKGNDKNRALIFNALRMMTKFYRPE
jgi:membrane-anchored protein YejM (alkaline phosphatase superfamily)